MGVGIGNLKPTDRRWIMDANEIIVEECARVCRGQLTITDVKFAVSRNYSNIDILAYDPKHDCFYDYEVKWRATEWIGATPPEQPEALVKQMTREERADRIKCLIGETNYSKLKRVFVTPKHWLKSPKGQLLVAELARANIELKYFEDVIADLKTAVTSPGRYDSTVVQLVRVIGFCSSNS
jgi:hypothetical protein